MFAKASQFVQLFESLVDPEPDLRCEFQVNVARDLAAQVALVAFERRDHGVGVAAAERHHVNGREPQISGHLDLRHRDQVSLDHGGVHLAARQQLRQRMTDELADAQLALRRACWLVLDRADGRGGMTILKFQSPGSQPRHTLFCGKNQARQWGGLSNMVRAP